VALDEFPAAISLQLIGESSEDIQELIHRINVREADQTSLIAEMTASGRSKGII
jgi:hypothetical protein